MGRRAIPIPEKLLSHTLVGDGCWGWQGHLNPDGYGKLDFRNKTFSAHRAMYELLIGPIPEGMYLDHLCRVRSCVNPSHLEPVTNKENIRRGHVSRGVSGGRDDSERRSAARMRYKKRRLLGLPGPYVGESSAQYADRIDSACSKHPGYVDTMADFGDAA